MNFNLPPDFEPEYDETEDKNTKKSKFNDKLTFTEQIKGVKKIKQDHIAHKTPVMERKKAAMLQHIAEDEKKEDQMEFFSTSNMTMVDPLEDISYHISGLQYGVMKKLKAGEYQPQAWVDLHNSTVENAYKSVRRLIVNSVSKDLRCVLIVHGKGEFSKPKALLKSYVAHWLKLMPEVIGYHTAMPYHGDKGATYVLLKKYDITNENTRELADRKSRH